MQSSQNLSPVFLPASVFPSFSQEKKKRKHSSGTTEHIPFFQLFWLRAICFNDELILRVHSAALPARAVMPFAHVRSGPRSNLRLITAGEAKSRNGTQLLPAALNYISTTGFPSPSFGVFLLVSAASLFVFDLSLFPALFSPPSPLNRNILYPPTSTYTPSASLFISWSLFLALCRSLLPLSIRSRHSSGGNSSSAAGSEFQASFIEFALDSGRACLPIRSWWGASRLWANPQIHLEPACVSKCVYLSVERHQTLPRLCWRILEGLSWLCSFPLHTF